MCQQFGDCCVDYNSTCAPVANLETSFANLVTSEFHKCYSLPLVGDVFLIDTCSASWTEPFIQSQCKHYSNGMPVFDDLGNNFRNIFCAICNYRKLSRIHTWKIIPVETDKCLKSLPCGGEKFCSARNQCFIIKKYHLQVPPYSLKEFLVGSHFRVCYKDECPTTSTPMLSRKCNSYVFFHCPFGIKNKVFKNPHCAVCNGHRSVISDEIMCNFDAKPSNQLLWQFQPNRAQENSFSDALSETSCQPDEALDPVTQSCQEILCRPGYMLTISGRCVTNQDTRLHVTNNWICATQKVMVIFKRKSVGYDHASCLQNKLRHLSSAEMVEPDCVNIFLHDHGLLWISFEFDTIDGFQLLRQIGNAMHLMIPRVTQSEDFCNVSEVKGFISCNKQASDEILACQDELYSGTPSEFLHINMTNEVNLTFFVTDNIYISTRYLMYYEHLSLERNRVRQTNIVFVCGHEAAPSNLECASITLDSSEFILSLNKTILTYAKIDFQMDKFILLGDGTAQICVDSVLRYPVEAKDASKDIFSSYLDMVSFCTVMLTILGLIGTLVTYTRFKKLRNSYGKGIMSLSISLFWSHLLTVMSNLITLSEISCIAWAITSHYFVLATFTWTTILALNLFNKFALKSKMRQQAEAFKSVLIQQLVGWGLPLPIVITVLILNVCRCMPPGVIPLYDSKRCWLRPGIVNLFAFGVPVAVTLVTNLILVIMTLTKLRKARYKSNRLQNKPEDTNSKREVIMFWKVSTKYIFLLYCYKVYQ